MTSASASIASISDSPTGVRPLATITVRNLDGDVQRRLRQRAAANGRSMEAEARAILTAAVARPGLGAAWVAATRELRGDALPIPPRSAPREVDLA